MIQRLFQFAGGISLRGHKKDSTTTPVIQASIPSTVVLPLQQHIGNPAQPIVNVGDYVYRGQIIAQHSNDISVPIHASTSGTVVAIEHRDIPHPSGLNAPCIVINADGRDESRRKHDRSVSYRNYSPADLREMIRNAGIVGLGGAGFPSYIKLNNEKQAVETLILNGAECEPYITCDEMLMREQSVEIIEGLAIMRHALQAKRCIIAIENNKPKALQNIKLAVNHSKHDFIDIVEVPTLYPAGGERQLIQTLTGLEVPSQGRPIDIGIVCHNVGTAYAIARAIEHGEPLISRYVTVAGSVAKARVLEVRLGTLVSDLIEQCGGNRKTLSKVIMGGPMMGFALHSDEVPVIKTTNCILVNSRISDVPLPSRADTAMPCIRCGLCAQACPVGLLPQQLYWYSKAKDFDKVQDYNVFDCIECGCCDYVCPSQIPLVQYYRYAKTEIWQLERERKFSDISRQRFEFRNYRLEREKREREEKHKQKRQAVSQESAEDKKKAIIKAAMERVQNKHAQTKPPVKNTDNLTEEQKKLIEQVNARRAKNKSAPETQSKPKD